MSRRLPPHLIVAAVLLLVAPAEGAPKSAPAYTPQGRMLFPVKYREWVFLSSGLNMSYTAGPATDGQNTFGNTFVPADAYAAFQRTGVWPDKTVIMLENRGGASKGSINKRGLFQTTDYLGAEAHVKDKSRFAGGWGFFAFDPAGNPAQEIPHTASCYSCHQQHAAADTTFVQFYPTLLPTATKLKTLSPSYIAETAGAH